MKLVAVGWLQRGKPFSTGQVDQAVYEYLLEMRRYALPSLMYLGVHRCDLCGSGGAARGNANLFVPGKGSLYVAPELIVHYMNAHSYAPPQEFCRAVLACPPVRSREYTEAVSQFDAIGLLGALLRELRTMKPRNTPSDG